ncbi:hypothetical protein [Pseudooceanicola sp.]|uniref:hypothetical protein n=1 Tax=Pseudooceanicola sp. TaxID=1914328 RepID=UPI004059F4F2
MKITIWSVAAVMLASALMPSLAFARSDYFWAENNSCVRKMLSDPAAIDVIMRGALDVKSFCTCVADHQEALAMQQEGKSEMSFDQVEATMNINRITSTNACIKKFF